MHTVKIFILFLFCFLGIYAGSAQKYFESTWYAEESDQIPDRFNIENFEFNKSHHIYYRVFNTPEDILVDLYVEDELAQRKILRLGLTVWIDPLAKKKKKVGVKFPLDQSFDRGQGRQGERLEGGGRGNFSQSKRYILDGKNELQLIGFNDSDEPITLPSSNDDFHGQMKFDTRGNLMYRLVIPVGAILDLVPFKESNILSLGLESGYINQSNMSGQRPGGNAGAARGGGPPGGGRSGGGGRPPGGGRPGGGNSGQMAERQQEMQQMTFPVKVWIKKIKLAEK